MILTVEQKRVLHRMAHSTLRICRGGEGILQGAFEARTDWRTTLALALDALIQPITQSDGMWELSEQGREAMR